MATTYKPLETHYVKCSTEKDHNSICTSQIKRLYVNKYKHADDKKFDVIRGTFDVNRIRLAKKIAV